MPFQCAVHAGKWVGAGKYLVFTHHILSVHFPLVVPMLLRGHMPPLPSERDIRSIPCAPTQTRASRHHVTLRPTRSCLFGQNGQPKWRPGFFFSFFKDVVEIPRRVRLSLRRLWLRPLYKEIPATLTSRAFSRPKWRGCSPLFITTNNNTSRHLDRPRIFFYRHLNAGPHSGSKLSACWDTK